MLKPASSNEKSLKIKIIDIATYISYFVFMHSLRIVKKNRNVSRSKQLGFKLLDNNSKKFFGGAHLRKSHAKTKRPITTNQPMHLVLRSSLAKGAQSFLLKDKQVYGIVAHQAKKHGVKLYNFANGGNHIHLLVMPRSRSAFVNFVRSISGLIARLILGVERGRSKGYTFWDQRPYTDLVSWGRHFNRVKDYLNQNILEAYGFIEFKPRKVIKFSTA